MCQSFRQVFCRNTQRFFYSFSSISLHAYIKPTWSLHGSYMFLSFHQGSKRLLAVGSKDFSLVLVSKFSREFCSLLGSLQLLVRHLAENSLENFVACIKTKYCKCINRYVLARYKATFCFLKSSFLVIEKLLFAAFM